MSSFSNNIDAAIDCLAKELPAAIVTLRFAALLPPESVPWPWLQMLSSARHPDVADASAGWEQLARTSYPGSVVEQQRRGGGCSHACGSGRPRAQTLDPNAEQELRRELRRFVGRRLEEFKELKRRLTDEVLRDANGGKEVTAWTVPSAEKAAASAASNKLVQVILNRDGSFNISLREGALWEEKCLEQFCCHQFASEIPDSIEWALRTYFVPDREIHGANERIAKMYADPSSVQGAVIHGLMLLNLANVWAGYGSWRRAWGYASHAGDIFGGLHDKLPEDADVSSLLEEAKRLQHLYDD